MNWVKSINGWGLTEYRARGAAGEYFIKHTGGRHLGWELRLNGERVSPARTLRSAKAIAEMRDERFINNRKEGT